MRCRYPGCNNNFERNRDKSFHAIPNGQRVAVADFLGIEDRYGALKICQDHFKKAAYDACSKPHRFKRGLLLVDFLEKPAAKSTERSVGQQPSMPEKNARKQATIFFDTLRRHSLEFKHVSQRINQLTASLKRDKEAALESSAARDRQLDQASLDPEYLNRLTNEHSDHLFANLVRLHEIENAVLKVVGQDEDAVKSGVPEDLIKYIEKWNQKVLSFVV